MNGVDILLDTNVIIGLLKSYPPAVTLVRDRRLDLAQCAYSSITRMELLGYPDITEAEQREITDMLGKLTRYGVTLAVEDAAINLRRQRRIKLPDAIIAATAEVFDLELLTLDENLAKVVAPIPREEDGSADQIKD